MSKDFVLLSEYILPMKLNALIGTNSVNTSVHTDIAINAFSPLKSERIERYITELTKMNDVTSPITAPKTLS